MSDNTQAANDRINEASLGGHPLTGQMPPGRVPERTNVSISDLVSPEEAEEDQAAYDRLDHAPLEQMAPLGFGVGDNPGEDDLNGEHARAEFNRSDLETDAGVPNDMGNPTNGQPV